MGSGGFQSCSLSRKQCLLCLMMGLPPILQLDGMDHQSIYIHLYTLATPKKMRWIRQHIKKYSTNTKRIWLYIYIDLVSAPITPHPWPSCFEARKDPCYGLLICAVGSWTGLGMCGTVCWQTNSSEKFPLLGWSFSSLQNLTNQEIRFRIRFEIPPLRVSYSQDHPRFPRDEVATCNQHLSVQIHICEM